MISLTINDKKIEVEKGATVLQAAQKLGIKIPILCYHKALLPYGACRLCLVEIKEGNRTRIQTSCTYPATQNLIVYTDTEKVIKTRKIIAELLLARCPEVKAVQDVANELGIKETRFKKKDNDCILCGLCVRVCKERMGQSVISFVNRGINREVKTPYGISSEVCQVCGACAFICSTGKIKFPEKFEYSSRKPRPIPYEYNEGLISRPAIFIPYPQAVPNKATIDEKFCVRKLKNDCGICKEFCEAGAIDYEQKEEKLKINVGGIILSPGYELFDANSKKELGYDRFENVITGLEFERILSASGPYSGKVLRLSDKKLPKRIAFIQCVGSRDCDNVYCSSICCMYATKEAIIAKEHEHEVEPTIFFNDLRAFGKGFDAYYERAKKEGVRYIKCRPSSIKEVPATKNLKIQYIDDDGKTKIEEFNLVVLSTGLVPPEKIKELKEKFGIELNKHGFCKTEIFKPVETNKEGIFVCGPFTEPKDIPETVTQASGAASKVLSLLKDVKGTLIKPKVYPPEINVKGQSPRIGVFVCHCGTNIAGVVNVPDVIEYAKTLPDVVYSENNLYTCSNDTQEKIKSLIKEHNLNRVIVASCSPRTHEPLFRNTIREAGLNPYLFEMANIRDQCSWVHRDDPFHATKKAKDLVRMAVAKSRLLEPLTRKEVKIIKKALVIGAGLSGMTASLELANSGFEVYLIEKEKEPGGNLRRIYYLFNGEKPQEELKNLIERIKENKKINLYLSTKIKNVEGSFGNFKTKVVNNDGKETEFEHGVVIVTTGAKEYKPDEYFYGSCDGKVLTQLELEEKLANGKFIADAKVVVMIQCVGSRDNERPYCSRVCCAEAIKNAIKIKEKNKDTNVFILYRDIRTYGFKEEYYRKARELGVIFIRYDEDKKPEVNSRAPSEAGSGNLDVKVIDTMLNLPVSITADCLVLSVATVSDPDNKDIAQFLKVPLTQDNFFLEAHMKLRPVDFATDGVFLAGLAHSAKSIDESIIQALGASSRASTILSKDTVELEANISEVVDENCDGCAYCIDPCPYKALTLIEYMKNDAIKKTVELDESKCKGCGTCQATCPKKGIFVRGFKLEQISAMVSAALK